MSGSRTDLDDRPDPHLGRYLHAVVGRAQVAPPEREYDLVLRIQDGDRTALDQLIDTHLSFVVKVAGRFRNRGLSDRDLIAEGTLGLIMAARRIVMSPDARFIAMAVWWIHRAIQTAVAEEVRAPAFMRPCGCVQFDNGYETERGPNTAT
jgi:RNA polymerase primary sigma factor